MKIEDRLPAPRSLRDRQMITVSVHPIELHLLIEALDRRALEIAERPEMFDFADYLFRRIAELREAAR
jgi:hypothetical protein